MALLDILIYPDSRLTQKTAPVADLNDQILRSVKALEETMYGSPGVGLAAPQVGNLIQVVSIDVSRSKNPVPNHGLLTLINPVILHAEDEKIVREGCLSVPEYTANVARFQKVKVKALNPKGEEIIIEAEGFEAVAIQHELDHLNGVLFIHRIKSLEKDLFKRKIK